ncbi:MAG TPA: hypothetical protein PLJ30_03340 [Deltaproteobacteria bacterium]|jgi:hypothetical protein|nr:hypothetical protein [Deltaproteobacteria bacterium]MDI9543163.1 hypothetical protein [Pseudomonadota bacterium]NLW66565.1 hypothetical protein [Bacteriovoracaceae bacterium]HRR21056.1 hypothetical protein [Desulfomonilia bacterium]HON60519.1 hypothetical protein [Deltaproteobacteria bacterium]
MAYFQPEHRSMLIQGSLLAERIVSKETQWCGDGRYDVTTLAESGEDERKEGVFAHLLLLRPEEEKKPPLFRISLQDIEIFDFVRKHREIDLVSFFTFIMTHELLHIHRFSTGMADFYETQKVEEEAFVDSLTRLLLAKNPVTGFKNILTLLDKVEAAPLYSPTKIVDRGRYFHAYL